MSYNSPKRGQAERSQSAGGGGNSNNMTMSRSMNSSPVRQRTPGGGSPFKSGRENMGANFNTRGGNNGNASGKEFVLEEIVAGGDVDVFGADDGGEDARCTHTNPPTTHFHLHTPFLSLQDRW